MIDVMQVRIMVRDSFIKVSARVETLALERYHPEFKPSCVDFVTMGKLVNLFDHFFFM